MRALVYREEQVHQVEALGATDVLVGDMRSNDTLERAVDGSEGVYHICPNVDPDEFEIGNSIVASAVSANVGHFVFHSVLHPQVESMPHHWMKMRVEEVLLGSGLRFSILQPAPYMQNLQGQLKDILERGVYTVPYSADAPMSVVDLEDVAETAANVLNSHPRWRYLRAGRPRDPDPKPDGRDYESTPQPGGSRKADSFGDVEAAGANCRDGCTNWRLLRRCSSTMITTDSGETR